MPAALSAGDTAWVLVSSAMVMLMLPGLAWAGFQGVDATANATYAATIPHATTLHVRA